MNDKINKAISDIHVVVSSILVCKSEEVLAAEITATGLIVAAMIKKGLLDDS